MSKLGPPSDDRNLPDSVGLVIAPRPRDIGSFEVRRVLPHAKHRMVGPFIFFDHMGPVTLGPGEGMDVRPHPHIGLATLTYLFSGAIDHHDSLDCFQTIRPGDVNWMVAGSGITHSERTGPEDRAGTVAMEGLQTWIALPKSDEDTAPSFDHHPMESLPAFERDGVSYRLIAGTAFGKTAPVRTFSPIFYLHAEAPAGCTVVLPDEHEERAVYVVAGNVAIDGVGFDPGEMAVIRNESMPELAAASDSRIMLLGGAPMDGERHIWWNFVASSRERIEDAKRRWKEGGFAPVPGDPEFIPLPED